MLIVNVKKEDLIDLDEKGKDLFVLSRFRFNISLFKDIDGNLSGVKFVIFEGNNKIKEQKYNIEFKQKVQLEAKDIVFYFHNFLKTIKSSLYNEKRNKEEDDFLDFFILGFIKNNLLSSDNFIVKALNAHLLIVIRDTDQFDKVILFNKDNKLNTIVYEEKSEGVFDENNLIQKCIIENMFEDNIILELL